MDREARKLERVADTDASLEATAAVLRRRIRTGEFDEERARLAAYCGDAVAQQVCGVRPYDPRRALRAAAWVAAEMNGDDSSPYTSFAAWVRGLAAWSRELHVLVRAAVAAAEAVLGHPSDSGWQDYGCDGCRYEGADHDVDCTNEAVCLAIERVKAWLVCPCEPHTVAWADAHERAAGGAGWLPQPQGAHVGAIIWCARLAGEPNVRDAIQRALIEWALQEVRHGR